MEFSVVREVEEPLLGRKEFLLKVVFEGATPSRSVLRGALGDFLKVELDRLVLVRFLSEFGSNEGLVTVRVYSDPSLVSVERVKRRLPVVPSSDSSGGSSDSSSESSSSEGVAEG